MGVLLHPADTPAAQPPPRVDRGRLAYADRFHNADGSNKYTVEIGGGLTAPVGNTHHYLNTQYAAEVGFGRNFNRKFGLMLRYEFDRFGFTGSTLATQQTLYNYGISSSNQFYLGSLGGNSHIWSIAVDPVYNLYQTGSWGAFVLAGGGFYRKIANFTSTTTIYQDQSGYTVAVPPNSTLDRYSSNAAGFNGGVGITGRHSQYARERIFVEGRYIFMDNKQQPGFTLANIATTHYTGSDFYPANSNRTTYTILEAGIRF